MKINISQENFGTLCICAIRYCHGRETYMPELVQDIVGAHLKELSDKDIGVMVDDCEFQRRFNLYGNENYDKPKWLMWEKKVKAEAERRSDG